MEEKQQRICTNDVVIEGNEGENIVIAGSV